MSKTWRSWTVKELRRLEELRLARRTTAEIARELGRTPASVQNRIQQDGLPRAGVGERWLEVLRGPHTIAGAARAMGTTKWAVRQAKFRLRAAGFVLPPARRTDPWCPRELRITPAAAAQLDAQLERNVSPVNR